MNPVGQKEVEFPIYATHSCYPIEKYLLDWNVEVNYCPMFLVWRYLLRNLTLCACRAVLGPYLGLEVAEEPYPLPD